MENPTGPVVCFAFHLRNRHNGFQIFLTVRVNKKNADFFFFFFTSSRKLSKLLKRGAEHKSKSPNECFTLGSPAYASCSHSCRRLSAGGGWLAWLTCCPEQERSLSVGSGGLRQRELEWLAGPPPGTKQKSSEIGWGQCYRLLHF